MYVRTHTQASGDGWLAGWLAGWLDGWMDGWMDDDLAAVMSGLYDVSVAKTRNSAVDTETIAL